MQTISSLPAGTTFQFEPSLSSFMRDGTIINVTNSATLAEYSELKDGIWTQHRERIANGCMVKATGQAILRVTATGVTTTQDSRKRGKQTEIPSGEFSVQQLADLNNLETPAAHQRIIKLVSEEKIKRVRTVSGGRGRAKVIYTAV